MYVFLVLVHDLLSRWCYEIDLFSWHVFAIIREDGRILVIYMLTHYNIFGMLLLHEKFDTHDLKTHHYLKLPFFKKWFWIVEFGATKNIVFVTRTPISMLFSTEV